MTTAADDSTMTACIYTLVIGVVYFVVMFICHFLHKLFDTAETVEETDECDRVDDANDEEARDQTDAANKKTSNPDDEDDGILVTKVISDEARAGIMERRRLRYYSQSQDSFDALSSQAAAEAVISSKGEIGEIVSQEPDCPKPNDETPDQEVDGEKNDLEFTEWKELMWQPHASRNNQGAHGSHLRTRRPNEVGLRAESFQTRSSFHIPDDYERSEDTGKKVYSANDMKVQSTGDMKDMIREGKSLLSSDSESFEVERNRTDTSESLLASASVRKAELKKDFSKIMSEPQLTEDHKTPSSQPVKPKRVRLKVDDQIISDNDSPLSCRPSSLITQPYSRSSDLPTSSFELDRQMIIQEVEEEVEAASPMIQTKKISECEAVSDCDHLATTGVLDMKCASSSSFSSCDDKSPKSTMRTFSEESGSRKVSPGSPVVYIPETLVNTLPPEKARQILDEDVENVASTSDAIEVSSRRSSRPRAVNTSKFLNVLTDGRLDVNSAVMNDHNDTTPGSVHYFEDEAGNWVMYQFAETPESVNTETEKEQSNSDLTSSAVMEECFFGMPSTSSGFPSYSSGIRYRPGPSQAVELEIRESLPEIREASLGSVYSEFSEPDESVSQYVSTQSFPSRPGIRNMEYEQFRRPPLNEMVLIDTLNNSAALRDFLLDRPRRLANLPNAPRRKPMYRLFINKAKSWSILVSFDRQQLSTLMDIRQSWFENVFVVLLSMMVSFLGFQLLVSEIYHDLLMCALCFVIASSQYSLIKSVQPDSASPMHGYNRVIVFSRALYFCMFAGTLLIVHANLPCDQNACASFSLYSVSFNKCVCLEAIDFILTWMIVLLPVIFLFGLLPQCSTFVLFTLEQIDVHIFGGTAKASLISSIFSFILSSFFVSILSCLAVWAIDHVNRDNPFLFSLYCSLLLPVSYFLSRIPSDPTFFSDIIRRNCTKASKAWQSESQELPRTLKKIFGQRLQNSIFVCPVLLILFFALHISKIFSEPIMNEKVLNVIIAIAGLAGFLTSYLLPQLRKRLPWLYFDKPFLPLKAELNRNSDFSIQQAKVMIHEYIQIWVQVTEKYVLNTTVILAITTKCLPELTDRYGLWLGSFMGTVFALKLMRFNLCTLSRMYQVVLLGAILFGHDLKKYSEQPLMDFFVVTLIIPKAVEMFKKLQFVFTYVAPWQIPWGSTFHAFAQPISIPHSALLFTQAFMSSLLSAPFSPFMGSAMFIMSYPRPVKFWEKDYKTKRQDVTNRRLALHLDPSPVGDEDDSLNSIYYEHLARSLQIYLAGDIAFGRWGNVEQGNFYLMASESLNCLVHIVEVGNGFVTFQVRGLEFRGTYCHQREVDAINEEPSRDQGFCCCTVKKVPGLLSLNEAFSQRWLAWEVLTNSYIIDGYDITQLNSAQHNFASYEQKSTHSKLYVQSVIFLLVRCKKLDAWLKDDTIIAALHENGYSNDESLPVLDPAFDAKHHPDYDPQASGITREKFCSMYLFWIKHCASQQKNIIENITEESDLVSLCFALAIYARRALLDACNHHYEFYLFGIHALFKGAFSPSSAKDQWLFTDLDLVDLVVKPAIRMSIRLHLDNFISPDFLSPLERLYSIIDEYEKIAVFAHESDPKWREAVLNNTEKLLTLRHVVNESCESYRIITLHKKFLSFKIVKLNQECVRGLWAGQQQELIFLRNSNSERGSIQNARQALRNIINSSCDQPIGYPIYVSPLITSFIDSNKSVPKLIGDSLKFSTFKDAFTSSWGSFVERCLDGCTSGRYSSSQNTQQHDTQNQNATSRFDHQSFLAMSKHAQHQRSGSLGFKDTSLSSVNVATSQHPAVGSERPIFVSATSLNNAETTL